METKEVYFDPFADEGEQYFDPTESFTLLLNNYEAGKVSHDYTADEFVKDTEALLMDAAFVERFDAVQAIAAEMHRMCGEDHNLQSAMNDSNFFGDSESQAHIGHNHDENLAGKDKKDKKKKDKKKKRIGLLAVFLTKN